MLANQREFAQQWRRRPVKASEAVTEQAQGHPVRRLAHRERHREAVVQATETTGEKAAATARAARNATKA